MRITVNFAVLYSQHGAGERIWRERHSQRKQPAWRHGYTLVHAKGGTAVLCTCCVCISKSSQRKSKLEKPCLWDKAMPCKGWPAGQSRRRTCCSFQKQCEWCRQRLTSASASMYAARTSAALVCARAGSRARSAPGLP